jgi:hypothetical protein
MVYTDAIEEEIQTPSEDVENELCHDLYDKIWDLGEVSWLHKFTVEKVL